MLLSVLQTYAAIIRVLSLLLKCSLPTTLYINTQTILLNTHEQTNLLLDNCNLTKVTAASHTTHERMLSSRVVREFADYRAVPVNMYPPQVVCTERTYAASITVTFNTIYVIILTNMTLQIVIAAKNNVIAI
jgi:hypothetical protein